jgi:hypothetical protein
VTNALLQVATGIGHKMEIMKYSRTAGFICALLATTVLRADEGMWTFDRPPSQAIQQRYL